MAQINGYKEELQDELQKTDPNSHTSRLLTQEIERVEKGDDRKGDRSVAFIDVHPDQPQNVKLKVRIPIQEYPRVNFVGKLLGPKGSTLKGLQEETGCKMAVLGRGSMRDKAKEEELRKEGGKKYGHLNDELHVNVEVFAEMTEAYRRLSHAVVELKKFLVPDNNDEIRQQQMQEMMYTSPGESHGGGRGGYRGGPSGRGGPPMGRGAPGRGSASAPGRGGSGRGAPLISQAPAPPMRGRGAPRGHGGAAPPTPRGRGAAPPRGRGGAAPPPQSSGYDDYGYSNSGHGDGYDDGYSSRGYGDSGYTEEQGDSQYYGGSSRGQTSSGGYDDGYSSYDYGYSWGSESGGYGPVRSSGQGGGASKPRSHPYGGGY